MSELRRSGLTQVFATRTAFHGKAMSRRESLLDSTPGQETSCSERFSCLAAYVLEAQRK